MKRSVLGMALLAVLSGNFALAQQPVPCECLQVCFFFYQGWAIYGSDRYEAACGNAPIYTCWEEVGDNILPVPQLCGGCIGPVYANSSGKIAGSTAFRGTIDGNHHIVNSMPKFKPVSAVESEHFVEVRPAGGAAAIKVKLYHVKVNFGDSNEINDDVKKSLKNLGRDVQEHYVGFEVSNFPGGQSATRSFNLADATDRLWERTSPAANYSVKLKPSMNSPKFYVVTKAQLFQ